MAAEPVEAVARAVHRVALASAAVLLSCDGGGLPLITIDGTVEVPVAAQERFTVEAPGQLIIEAQVSGSPPLLFRAGVLCDAGVEPSLMPVTYTTTGCSTSTPATVRAWVAPRLNAALDFCGVDGGVGPWPIDVAPVHALAVGRQTVKPIVSTGLFNACTSAHLGVQVTLSEE
ncbi:MAG: hypothetical protein JNG84_14720 [Archangium sp.]|nr:hypothetical protein [Archangium sp.]